MVLHNISIETGASIARKLDLSVDPSTQEKRDREEIKKLLQMRDCRSSKDTSAEAVKLWVEKETGKVNSCCCFVMHFITETVITVTLQQ